MDLKKLFVYVPSASEDTFIANVIKKPNEAAKYANKIVFLEKTLRIWAKGQYYGSDPADVAAVWTALGIDAGTVPSGNYTVGESSYSYTGFNQKFDAFKQYTDAKIAVEKAEVVASYEGADSAIITAYQKADADLTNAYTAFKNKVGNIDSLDGTLLAYINKQDASARTEVKVSGSGLDIQKTQGAGGNDIYTITADQSIWEFCGTYACPDTTYVSTGLNSQYGTEEGAKREHAEVGDVWAVTLTNTGTTVLYACSKHTDGNPDTNVWVAIGAAEGIVDVNTSKSHGVALTKGGAIVGVSVTPGTITKDNESVITGGAAYTAIKAAQDNAYAYTSSVGKDIITGYRAAVDSLNRTLGEQITNLSSSLGQGIGQAMTKAEQAYSYANTRANEAQANAYAKIESAINALDAAYSGGEQIGSNNLFTYTLTQVDGQINAAEVTFDKTVMFNYVTDNIWETYGA